MVNKNLWYTRRDKEVRGPFPAGMISRYILLGRILESDELSVDQVDWRPVEFYPELYPDEMKLDLTIPENREKLRLARVREDERSHGDRRKGLSTSGEHLRQRSGRERRENEPEQLLRHRELRSRLQQTPIKRQEHYAFRIMMVVVFVMTVISLAIVYTPEEGIAINNCANPPAPYVNWSNCQFEGIRLAKENLTGAQFRNSTINGADLRGASLSDAEFSYANMSNVQLLTADLHNADMVGATLRNANMTDAKMVKANLSFAILNNAVLVNTDLRNANLTHAILNGAVLDGVKLDGAILDKAIWVDNSICAPGSVGRCIPLMKTGKH